MKRFGIIAALPGELKPLVKGWRQVPVAVVGIKKWVLQRGGDEWIAVCAGMGANAARRAFAAAEDEGTLDGVLSVGWAGATNAGEKAGTIMVPSIVIDTQTGESFQLTSANRVLRLATAPYVADATEKRRLRESYGAAVVDMEAAAIARLAEMREIPIVCIKAISDDADAELPDLNPFIDERGQMRMASFLSYVGARPKYWVPLARLGSHSAAAAKTMSVMIQRFMESKDFEQANRTGRI